MASTKSSFVVVLGSGGGRPLTDPGATRARPAAAAAIGLAILVVLFRNKKTLEVKEINELEG